MYNTLLKVFYRSANIYSLAVASTDLTLHYGNMGGT